jgi:hypothetical protein
MRGTFHPAHKTCETGDCVLSVKMSVVKTYVRYAPESLQNLPSLNYTEKLQHLQKERLGKNYTKLFSVKNPILTDLTCW